MQRYAQSKRLSFHSSNAVNWFVYSFRREGRDQGFTSCFAKYDLTLVKANNVANHNKLIEPIRTKLTKMELVLGAGKPAPGAMRKSKSHYWFLLFLIGLLGNTCPLVGYCTWHKGSPENAKGETISNTTKLKAICIIQIYFLVLSKTWMNIGRSERHRVPQIL